MRRTPWLVLLAALAACDGLAAPFAKKVAIAGRGWMPFVVAQECERRGLKALALCNEPSKGRKYLPEGSLVEIRKGLPWRQAIAGADALIFCSEFPVGASLPVTEEILGICAKAARAGRVAALHPAGTRRGGFSASNLLGAVDRARKVEDAIAGAGGAVVRVGELRGGGSEEPAPPGDGSLGKAFYDTNPDFGAALADQLFDASMRGVRVERGDTVESSITTAFGTFAGTTGRLGAARVLVEAATAVAPKARPAEGVSVAAVKAKQPPSEAEWGGLLRALSA